MSWLEELQRRNVFRTGLAYAASAWLLVQFADIMLPVLGVGDGAMRVLLIVLSIGLVPVLVFAWAYEITPEGIRKEAEVDRSGGATAHRLDRVIVALLVLGVAVFALDVLLLGRQTDRTMQATGVAVLPFVAMSSGEDDRYFADGLTEEIINSLSALPELLVTARTSSFSFRATDLTVPEIARALQVGHLVEGSVRRSGDTVRITAQLVRASDGFHHWSRTYDRKLDDIFVVQQDIAENVATVLNIALNEDDRERMRRYRIHNIDAFIAYQKGLEIFVDAHVGLGNISGRLAEANTYFDAALALVPGLTQARVLKADQAGHALFEIIAGFREPVYDDEANDAREALRHEYREALRLTPRSLDREVLEAERELFRDDWRNLPAKLDPALRPGDCRKINWIVGVAGPFGWAEDLVAIFRAAQRCDPLNVVSSFMLPLTLVWADAPEAALQAAEDADALGIRHTWLEEGRVAALRVMGRLDEARRLAANDLLMPVRPRLEFQVDAQAGAPDIAVRLEQYAASTAANDHDLLILSAAAGDRVRANAAAARIDRHASSAFVLSEIVFFCYCGAPFDLDATPNFKARVEEADLQWPPPSPIRYPGKTW